MAYATSEEFMEACRGYFASLKKSDAPNISGLAVSIGISRFTWYEYKKAHKQFSNTINVVEKTIEQWWVNRLAKSSPIGAIFYLKNFKPSDYKDRVSGDPESPISVQITGMRISKEAERK